MAKKRRRKKGKRSEDQAPKTPTKPVTDEIRAQIEAWSAEAAEANDLVLFDAEVNGAWLIRIYVDREGAIEPGQGVTVDECVAVSRYVEALLDIDETVPEKYTLEVSSPGVERKLTKWRQVPLVVGRTVRLVLKKPIDGKTEYEGELVAAKDDVISLDYGASDPATIDWTNVSKAQLTYEF